MKANLLLSLIFCLAFNAFPQTKKLYVKNNIFYDGSNKVVENKEGDESRKFKGKYYSMFKREVPESSMKYSGDTFTMNLTDK